MSANSNTDGATGDTKGGYSLRDRLKAWWDGTELLELPAASDADSGPDAGAENSTVAEDEGPRKLWEPSRINLVQKVWGDGFVSPGGRKHITDMVTSFGLDPSMGVLDLGAGLGGSARVMCEKFGVWVTGFEIDEDLAEAGMALSVKAGMGEKVPVQLFDPGTFEHKQASVDCVFSKEFLFAVQEKNKFLKAIEDLLKPKGQFLFTDFVLAEAQLRSPTLENWMENEPIRPRPWAVEDYEVGLVSAKLEVRVTEDITKDYRAMVIKGWSDYTGSAEAGGVGKESAPSLVEEVELWTRRIQAIDSGDLKVFRFLAFKKDAGLGMSH
jgi:SAM-dependent methyltransferase